MHLTGTTTGNVALPTDQTTPSSAPASAPNTTTAPKKEESYISYQAKSGDIYVLIVDLLYLKDMDFCQVLKFIHQKDLLL